MEKRFSQGLEVVMGYTKSKAIDNVGEQTSVAGSQSGFQDNYCFACDRALSDQNQPFAMRLAVRYELPFGPGKQMLNHGMASKVLGGWAIGAFYTLDAGRPLAVSSPNNTSSFGGGTGERPDATGVSAALPGGPKICDNCAYFNAAAFVQTPQYQFGDVSKYLPDVNNPTSYNIDSSFEKNTRIREGVTLTFRGGAV